MNLFKPLISMSLVNLLSRLSGFFRDIIIAYTFGAEMISDSFLIAFKIPNLLRHIFAEGAFSHALIPILVEYKNSKNIIEIRSFISRVSGLLILLLSIIVSFGIIFAPYIILIIAPGFKNVTGKFELTVFLLRIIFPYIILISLVSMASAILNTWRYFLIPSFTPVLLNVSMILLPLLNISIFHQSVVVLAWSVIFGGIIQLLYQIFYLSRINMFVFPSITFNDSKLWNLFNQMGSAIFGVLISQTHNLINIFLSSFFVVGSISWMYYADRIVELPAGIFGVVVGTILMPVLVNNFSLNENNNYSKNLDWGLRICIMLSIPSFAAIEILSYPLILVLFYHGNFSMIDVIMTSKLLKINAIGMVGYISVKILSSGFYACKDIKTPVRISVFVLFINQLMNIFFVSKFSFFGLFLSNSLSAYLNVFLLYRSLYKRGLFCLQPGWKKFLYKVIFAAIIMSILLVLLLHVFPDFYQVESYKKVLTLIFFIFFGGFTYFLILWLLKFRMY